MTAVRVGCRLTRHFASCTSADATTGPFARPPSVRTRTQKGEFSQQGWRGLTDAIWRAGFTPSCNE